jgi:signal transduction histidine kinase
MIVVCTYCIDKCDLSETIEVVNNHQLALIRRAGRWELIKNAERIRAEERAREYQTHLKTLASKLSLAEERERHRIATELHASISQNLVISKMKLDELRASAPSRDFAEILGEVCSLLEQTIDKTRTLTYDLSSPLLNELGFVEAVAEWLSEQIENKHGIKTEFIDDGQEKPLDDEMRVFLFRDVRELLMNVVKHAQAKKVKVSIRRVADQIQVSVEDDGWGFDPDKVSETAVKKGAFGLFSIRQRLEQLGGLLEIKSAPGQGANVTITAPLKREKNAQEK